MEENNQNQPNQTPSTPDQNLNSEQTPTSPPAPNKPKLKLPILIGAISFAIIATVISYIGLEVVHSNQIYDAHSFKKPIQVSKSPIVTPPPPIDETANWKTYTNTQYGFSFNYPGDWISKEYNTPGYSVFSIILKPSRFEHATLSDPGGEFPPMVSIDVINNSSNLSVDDYLKNNSAFASNFKQVELTGISGMRGYDGGATQNDNVFISKNGYIYKIRFNHAANSEIDVPIETFNKLLSTFKFTDQTANPSCTPRPACLDANPPCMMPELESYCKNLNGKQ